MRLYKLLEFAPQKPTAILAQTVDCNCSEISDVLHEELHCDHIEITYVKIAGRDFMMLVDGECVTREALPKRNVNIPAWFFYSGLDKEHVIFGDVLIGKEGTADGKLDLAGLDDKDLFDISKEIEVLSYASARIDSGGY